MQRAGRGRPGRGGLCVAAMLAALLALAGCATPSGSSGSTGDAAGSDGSGSATSGEPATTSTSGAPSTTTPADAIPLPKRLAGRSFESTAVTGYRLAAGTRLTIRFAAGGHLSWQAGCNSMGAAATWEGSTLSVGQVISTEMGCAAPLMAQDEWFAGLLKSGVHAALDDDALILTGGDVTLRFADDRIANPDVSLQGTTWILDGIITGTGPSGSTSSVPQGIRATLRIADGKIHFFDGLNDYDGPTGPGAALVVGPDSVTIKGAIAGSAAGCAEGHTCSADMSLLTSSFGYTIAGTRLTVTGTGAAAGHGLMFVAEQDAAAPSGSGSTWKSPPIVSPGQMTPLPTSATPRTPLSGRHDSIPPQPTTR